MYMYSNIKILKNTKFHVLNVYNFMFNFESRLRILKLLFFFLLPPVWCFIETESNWTAERTSSSWKGKQLEKNQAFSAFFIRLIVTTTLPFYYKQLFNPIKEYIDFKNLSEIHKDGENVDHGEEGSLFYCHWCWVLLASYVRQIEDLLLFCISGRTVLFPFSFLLSSTPTQM